MLLWGVRIILKYVSSLHLNMVHRKSDLININRGDRYGGRERGVYAWREG